MKPRARTGWLLCGVLCLGVGSAPAPAESITVPAEWLRAAPGPREAALIEAGSAKHGWPAMGKALRAAALDAYARGNLTNARAWATVARWAAMWGTTEAEEEARWRAAMEAESWPAGWGERRDVGGGERLLAERLPAALRERLLAEVEWSAGYFAQEKALDRRGSVLALLARLHARDAKAFEEFPELAMAVALVHDTSPPSDWPHWQVPPQVLPRRLAPAEEVFDHLVRVSRDGKALWRADKLDVAELRFVVDLTLPAEEREWALSKTRTSLSKLAETYSMISYRTDRIAAGVYVWPGDSYRLEDILREGGICVDQAYFATQAGKARGVPTILFAGAGRDGRHAWFGYLGTSRKWVMDAGRYEEQNYVTGVAHDPQTWTEVSDHELKFLSEGFRRERNARDAQVHADFARWLLEEGRTREAETAARAAVRLERRTLDAWDVLLALRAEPGTAREALAREAASGLSSYPDLQIRYMEIAVASLRARGEEAEADRIGRELARRFAGKRGDLSTKEISGQLARAMTNSSVEEQVRLYRSLMRRFGRGAGAGMWDEVVRPFVVSHAAAGRWKEARDALALARETLDAAYGSQMDTEMRELETRLSAAARAAGEKK